MVVLIMMKIKIVLNVKMGNIQFKKIYVVIINKYILMINVLILINIYKIV